MKTFQLKDDDLVVTNDGNLEIIEGEKEICQCVERAITTRMEEWFLNMAHGMDYEETKEKAPNLERIKADIAKAALQENRLNYLSKIELHMDRQKRTMTVSFVGTLKDGSEIFGEVAAIGGI